MPLAQNFKDDVSLLESEATLTKTTIKCMNREPPVLPQRFHMNIP
ncbi:unnamed protein product, partial [Adineta steineri]